MSNWTKIVQVIEAIEQDVQTLKQLILYLAIGMIFVCTAIYAQVMYLVIKGI